MSYVSGIIDLAGGSSISTTSLEYNMDRIALQLGGVSWSGGVSLRRAGNLNAENFTLSPGSVLNRHKNEPFSYDSVSMPCGPFAFWTATGSFVVKKITFSRYRTTGAATIAKANILVYQNGVEIASVEFGGEALNTNTVASHERTYELKRGDVLRFDAAAARTLAQNSQITVTIYGKRVHSV